MLSFQGHWKYPVEYVLVDEVNVDDLNFLWSRILDLCAENNINVWCITIDGTAVNFNSMKLFDWKLGRLLEEINGGFTHDSYNSKLCFILDPTHMLKLACNTLGEQGILLDSDVKK